jgi:hypothetical protein
MACFVAELCCCVPRCLNTVTDTLQSVQRAAKTHTVCGLTQDILLPNGNAKQLSDCYKIPIRHRFFHACVTFQFRSCTLAQRPLTFLKLTGYMMTTSLSRIARSAHNVVVFCVDLRTNSDLCHLLHKLIGFYNRDEKCLQRGTDWVFI